MGSPPFAFSVHNFISSVGADAGFAAIIGLAILVLLYFAHARETANLREEAALLAARLQQAEARVAELSRPAPVAVPGADAVQVTDQRGVPLGPFAPAGTAAPALAAATHVVPLVAPPGPPAPDAGRPEPAVAVAGASPAAVSAAAAAPVAASARAPAVVSAGQPSSVASAAPPASPGVSGGPPVAPPASPGMLGGPPVAPPASPSSPPSLPGPATAAGGNGAQKSARPLSVGSAPARNSTVGTGTRTAYPLPPLGPPTQTGGSRARRVLLAVGAVLLVAAAAVALVVITSSHDSSTAANHARTTNTPASQQTSAFAPSAVTVAVLNGTSTNELAHHVAAKLATEGYRKGRIATAANQTLTTSIVAYLPGARNRNDALHVANSLHLRSTAVRPIDQGTQQVACPPPGACGANVVVTVGADLATL